MSAAIFKLIDREILGVVPGPNGSPHPYFDDIRQCLTPIREIRTELSARKQVVGLMGPARSGVSTLINSLIGSPVCPTGVGSETTARPVMVTYSKKPGVEIYSAPKSPSANDPGDHMGYTRIFLDHFKGDLPEEAFLKAISHLEKSTLSLSGSTLKSALAGPLQKEPVMIVVRTPEWVLKTDQICFIDFPGLDGFKHNYQKNPEIYELIRGIDFLILNQSTFAALDRSMILFLKKMLGGQKMPPVWLVHNRVDAKYWRDKEANESEMQHQLDIARSILSSEFQIPEMHLPINIINLGKAHDGIFSTREALFYESHFEDFERNFMASLHSRKLQKLVNISEDVMSRMPLFSDRLECEKASNAEMLEYVRTIPEIITNADLQENNIESAFGKYGPININVLLTQFRESMQARMDQTLVELREACDRNKNSISATEANQIISRMIEGIDNDFKSFSWERNPAISTPFCIALDDLSRSIESGYTTPINKKLVAYKMDPLAIPDPWSASELPALNQKELKWLPVKYFSLIFGFIPWPKRYQYTKLEDYVIYQLFGTLLEQVVEQLNGWRDELQSHFIKRQQTTFRHFYYQSIQKRLSELESEMETKSSKAMETRWVLDKLSDSLFNLHHSARSELTALTNKKWSAKF